MHGKTLIPLKGNDVIFIPGREITTTIIRREIAGFTVCNTYSIDEVEINNESLVFILHYPAKTELFCKTLEGLEFTDQESEYLTILVSGIAYSISDGQLELKNDYGDVILIFQK